MMAQNNISSSIQNIVEKRWVQHLGFWLSIILLETFVFIGHADIHEYPFAIGRHVARMCGILFVVYLNLRVYIPFILKKGRYVLYVIAVAITAFGVGLLLFYLVKDYQHQINLLIKNPWPPIMFYFFNTGPILILTMLTSLIHFAKHWITLRDVEAKITQLEKDKIEAEHKALKAQVNPHFLFNTLNNIYSLSLDKSDKSPEMLLKLSDLLSYLLYECKDDKVVLQKETEFLMNYIELERIRVGEVLAINVFIDDDIKNDMITPLLFIPFVENAFKHTSKKGLNKSYIDIRIEKKNEKLAFTCINTIDTEATNTDVKYHGIGIDNVIKRLELLYNDRHQLEIHTKKETFEVKLILEID